MHSLDRLLIAGLESLYGAHGQGSQQAARNEQTSSYPKLKLALKLVSEENLKQTNRLEKVFKLLGVPPVGRADAAMQGIIDANHASVAETTVPVERDLLNIALSQSAAHFFLTRYGTLRTYAEQAGHEKVADLLQTTLREMAKMDKKFTRLAHDVMEDAEAGSESHDSIALGLLKLGLNIGASTAVAVAGTWLLGKTSPGANAGPKR